ncbi:glycosyltransferase [Planotetraspora sp. A-T 1434]|uniref:glycosyltransferase n=1 Tax=Planotetraspora sp. A-T 1434 TaxID=2979219 RepID=UPI0021C1DF0E|nr:glycosyltransferase [Planotetraspora sp. A-T 1434]MCT9934372.1 glycosyltransferase [Planotetraspora sp. A-T 1434]
MAEHRDVFIVCNNFEELGGLQRWVHHIGRLFAERGHRVHLIGITHAERAHDYGSDLPYATTVLYERRPAAKWQPRGALDRLNVPAQVRMARRRAGMRRAAARLSEIFRTGGPGSVVIAAQVWAMEWVALADTRGMTVIGMSHESYAATRSSSRYERVKTYFSGVDSFLVLTQEDADAWAAAGMSAAGAMPNPLHVHPERISSLDEQVVVRLGRMSFEKGQDLLLEAWAKVAPRHPGWRLRLYGSGPDEAEIRALAGELGLTGSVEFPGPTDDLETALTGGSIFALSSREEGFPMSILEAMAYGLPTVAFDCAPGVRELITHDVDGLIVHPGNTVKFAASLERLMNDAGLRRSFGAAARASVTRFAPHTVVDQWERLFTLLER